MSLLKDASFLPSVLMLVKSVVDLRRLSYAAREFEGVIRASLLVALSIKRGICKFKHGMQAVSRDASGKGGL